MTSLCTRDANAGNCCLVHFLFILFQVSAGSHSESCPMTSSWWCGWVCLILNDDSVEFSLTRLQTNEYAATACRLMRLAKLANAPGTVNVVRVVRRQHVSRMQGRTPEILIHSRYLPDCNDEKQVGRPRLFWTSKHRIGLSAPDSWRKPPASIESEAGWALWLESNTSSSTSQSNTSSSTSQFLYLPARASLL
jgi:hypothetical protein